MLFFPDNFAVFADFEDAVGSSDELGLLAGGLFDLSRHTDSFGEVISLGAVFNLELHLDILDGIGDLASEIICCWVASHSAFPGLSRASRRSGALRRLLV